MRLRGRLLRLARLQREAPARECRVCGSRPRIVFVNAKRLKNGEVVPEEVPEPCAVCGKAPEMTIEVVVSDENEDAVGGAHEP